jgi:hypothetical protein
MPSPCSQSWPVSRSSSSKYLLDSFASVISSRMALAATLVLSVDALFLRFFILDRHSCHTMRLRPQDRGVSCLVRWSLRRHSPFEVCAGWAGADPQEWGRDHMKHRIDPPPETSRIFNLEFAQLFEGANAWERAVSRKPRSLG